MQEPASSPQAASEREERLHFLDELARVTRTASEPAAVMTLTATMLGRHLRVNRCAYAHCDEDQEHFELIGDYTWGVSSIVGRYAFSDFGEVVRDLMRAGIPYVNADVDHDPATAGSDLSAYRQTQIQAVICVPLLRDGRFVAAMAVHQSVPRAWTDHEVELVQLVVARCWESLERLRVERAFRLANERLSLALAAGRLGAWSWDAATDLVTLSDEAADAFSLAPETPVTWAALRELLHPDDREKARLAVEHAAATDTLYDVEYRLHKDGHALRWLAAQGKPTYGPDGSLQGMIGVVRDITQRRKQEERALNESQMLELLNQTGTAVAAELDINALLQRVTDAATQLTGARFGAFFYNGTDEQGDAYLLYTLCGAPKEAFEKFGHPRPTPLFGPTFNGAPVIRCDDVLADPRYGRWAPHHGMPAGHLPVRSYLAVAVTSRTGDVFGGLFFGHPEPGVFTERAERLALGVAGQAAVAIDNARLYADVRRSSAMKDEFLATLSHELRTPLSAILGWTHILRRKYPAADAELGKGIAIIERNARAQTQLIEDLLDMSRITMGKLRLDIQPVAPISFIEAAVETIRPTADAAGVRIQTVLDPSAGPVSGDPGRLQQVIWNLLSNAVKFSRRNGSVQVVLERVNSHVEITVSDAGIGIAAEALPHIFDRFRQADGSSTRRHSGLGLGLAIVKQLVELHGGRVFAKSPGKDAGATFAIHLPVKAVQTGSDETKVHPQALSPVAPLQSDELAGLRILIVDDEADAREMLQLILVDCGAQVTAAQNAEEALRLVRTLRPDILVSDIGMPDVDGYELIRRVRALGPEAGGHLPAVALTAFARSEDRVRALRAGFRAHVAKPVEAAEMVATLASLAGR